MGFRGLGALGFSSLLGVTNSRLRILEGNPNKNHYHGDYQVFERGVGIELSRLSWFGVPNP